MHSPDLISRTVAACALLLTLLLLGLWEPQRFTPLVSEPYHSLNLQIAPLSAPTKPVPATNTKVPPASPSANATTQQKPSALQKPQTKPALELSPKANSNVAPVAVHKLKEKTKPSLPKTPAPKPKAVQDNDKSTPRQTKATPRPRLETTSYLPTDATLAGSAGKKPKEELQSGGQTMSASQAKAQEGQQAKEAQARQFISAEIVSFIKQATVYPRQALRRKIQGTVMLEFTVKNGIIVNCKVAQSAGSPLLDRAALQLGQELIGFDSKQQAFSLTLRVPIRYALR